MYRQIKDEEDLKALAETDKIVFDMGFDLDEDSVRAKYGDGWSKRAAPGAPLAPPLPVAIAPASFAEAAAPPAQSDALDALIDAEQAQWRPVMDPLVEPIRVLLADAAARGQSAAELLERLPELLTQLDADPLAHSLTRTASAARLAGDAGLPNE